MTYKIGLNLHQFVKQISLLSNRVIGYHKNLNYTVIYVPKLLKNYVFYQYVQLFTISSHEKNKSKCEKNHSSITYNM